MDPELAARARRGDAWALEALLKALAPRLLGLARRLACDPALAEDLVTESLYRGSTRLRRLREPGAVEAWFRRILLNLWRDHLRKVAGRDAFLVSLEDLPEPAAPAAFDPRLRLDSEELRGTIEKALAELPPCQRAVISLRMDEGLSVAEIAEALDTTADRVKANLWHARRRLRELLSGLLGGEPADVSAEGSAEGSADGSPGEPAGGVIDEFGDLRP